MTLPHLIKWHTALKQWRETSGKKIIPSKIKNPDDYKQLMQIYKDLSTDQQVEQPTEKKSTPTEKKVSQTKQKPIKTIKERVNMQKFREVDVQLVNTQKKNK